MQANSACTHTNTLNRQGLNNQTMRNLFISEQPLKTLPVLTLKTTANNLNATRPTMTTISHTTITILKTHSKHLSHSPTPLSGPSTRARSGRPADSHPDVSTGLPRSTPLNKIIQTMVNLMHLRHQTIHPLISQSITPSSLATNLLHIPTHRITQRRHLIPEVNRMIVRHLLLRYFNVFPNTFNLRPEVHKNRHNQTNTSLSHPAIRQPRHGNSTKANREPQQATSLAYSPTMFANITSSILNSLHRPVRQAKPREHAHALQQHEHGLPRAEHDKELRREQFP
nr:MAG TPA: hypothetical protein [Caudoviricetes sp.]